jgi:hypothetical protein
LGVLVGNEKKKIMLHISEESSYHAVNFKTKKKREDIIKMCLSEGGCKDAKWMKFAYDRYQWRI